jgi:hypothetical protein
LAKTASQTQTQNSVMKNWREIAVVLLVIAGCLGLRLIRIDKDLLIHYDQGRDLLVAYQIWKLHKPTLLGPAADIQGGIFFGPIYYYLIAIPLAFSGGNPVSAMIFLQVLEAISGIFLYIGAKRLFGRRVAVIGLFWVAVSYGLASYSRWLSNAMPAIALGNVIFYLTAQILTGQQKLIPLLFFTVGVLWQFDPAIGFGLIFFALYLWFIYERQWKKSMVNLMCFLFPATPQILFDLRHHFLITKAVLNFLFGSTGAGLNLSRFTGIGWQFLSFVTSITAYHLPVIAVGLLIITVWQWRSGKSYQVISLLILSQVGSLFIFKGVQQFFYLGIGPALLILLTACVVNKFKKPGLILLLGLIAYNLYYMINAFSQPGINLVPIGTANLVTLDNRLQIINYLAHNVSPSYSLWTYTLPYFEPQAWQYLMLWKKVPNPIEHGQYLLAIWEKDWQNPYHLQAWQEKANQVSSPIAQFSVGNFTIEKRQWIKN